MPYLYHPLKKFQLIFQLVFRSSVHEISIELCALYIYIKHIHAADVSYFEIN